ncbi:MAG: nuclear transport factor 2 family protein [Bacteroidota bacterium]
MKNSVFKSFTFLGLLALSGSLIGQNYDLSTPEATVKSLFKSMYDGDSTLAKLVFTKDASLNSVFTTKQGEQKINEGNVQTFINAIGSTHDEVWDERISNLSIKIDADLAHAWMDYSFYLGDKFSHCGVNAMHLIRIENQWKIFQIIDTRRKTNCNF